MTAADGQTYEPPGDVCTGCGGVGWTGSDACTGCDGTGWDETAGTSRIEREGGDQ